MRGRKSAVHTVSAICRGSAPPSDQSLRSHGTKFTALSSSWAPFIVAASTVLKPGGRMAFVVPAEIGHAPYAQPVLKHLAANFDRVQVLAVRRKLFPDLSEDCWLLYCDGFGGKNRPARVVDYGCIRLSGGAAQTDFICHPRRLAPVGLSPSALPAAVRHSITVPGPFGVVGYVAVTGRCPRGNWLRNGCQRLLPFEAVGG